MMSKSASDYAEHRGLLRDHLTEVHGALAAKITDRLLAVGSSNLKDLADFIRTKEAFGDEAAGALSGNGAGTGGILHTPQIPVGAATHMHGATDKEIKFTLATLLQHNVVAHDTFDKSYAVQLGQGLLQFLLPSFIRFLRAELGDAGDVVISLLARYSRLTLGAIEREVLRSAVVAVPQVKKAMAIMRAKGWIVACGGGGGGAEEQQPSEKKLRSEATSSSSALPTLAVVGNTPFEISFSTLLHAMRASAVKSYATERFDPLGARILVAMLQYDHSVPSQRGNNNTYTSALSAMATGIALSHGTSVAARNAAAGFAGAPVLPVLSTPVTINDLYRAVVQGVAPTAAPSMASSLGSSAASSSGSSTVNNTPLARLEDLSQAAFIAKLSELCSEDFGGLLQQHNGGGADGNSRSGGFGGGGSESATYVLNYNQATTAMRDRLVQKVIFARYGVVGTRILTLLLQKNHYEDRHLAEEAICTLFEAREALLGMLRDGYVIQTEIPKSKIDPNAERNPKNSNYLWSVNRDNVVMHARRHMVTACRNTRARLLFEFKRLEERFPAQFSKGAHWLLNGGGVVPTTASAAAAAAAANDPTGAAAGGNTNGFASNKGTLTATDNETLLRLRFACRALNATQMAQMEMMLLMDYY